MPRYEPNSDTSSATTLSEDTHQILSFWQRYVSQRAFQGGSNTSHNSTAALVSDYLSAIPCSACTNNSEAPSEDSRSGCSDHGYCRRLPDDQTSWASALGIALLVLMASLLLAAVSLTVYNIQSASNVFGTNVEPDYKPPEVGTDRPSLIAARTFKTVQRPQETRVTSHTSRRTLAETVQGLAPHEVTTQTVAAVMRGESSTGYGEISEAKLVCGAVFYSYCTRSTPKFHYDLWEKACTASRGRNAALCIKGSNRFASKMACERSCVLGERRSARCADATTFASCARPDYRGSSLWYFNGRRCRLWEFQAGKCPSRADGAVLFRTSRQCEKKCGSGARHGEPPRPPPLACRAPASARCQPDELRYTYFAVKSATRTRCLSVSAPALASRLCLSGANRFSTRASCERMCGLNTQHSPVEYDANEV